MNIWFSCLNWCAFTRALLPLIGLVGLVGNAVAIEREQATITHNPLDTSIQFHSSNLHYPSTWRTIDVEVCKGDCTFVVYSGDAALLMEKNSGGQVRELVLETRERLSKWSTTIDIQGLSLDLSNNPIVDIGGTEYVFTQIPGQEIWRVSEDDQNNYENEIVSSAASVESPVALNALNAGPTGPTKSSCVGDPVPEKRDIHCNVAVNNCFITWNECFVTRCEGGWVITSSCLSKSVVLPQEATDAVFKRTFTNCK